MNKLAVHLTRSPSDSLLVGHLAEADRRIYFEYDDTFIETGLQLSPFKMPLRSGLIEHTDLAFGPLPGLFDDSLPDGWGLLLMDRHFRRQGVDLASVGTIDRLAYLGLRTMGALTYHPPQEIEQDDAVLDLFSLGQNAQQVLAGDAVDVLPQLERAGGSPGGARPKILVGVNGDKILSGDGDLPESFVSGGGEYWIIKFAAKEDAQDAGPTEYAYALMAKAAGIDMPPVRLFEASKGRSTCRYFGVRRFDRDAGSQRIHMHTFANMIHANFRIPSTDYSDLLKVTRLLTRNHRDVLEVFRRMVFNIAAHNRDDHAKNFAFRLRGEKRIDGAQDGWSVAPAYDLTYSRGPGGEHTMTVAGEGRRPSRDLCLGLASEHGIKAREADTIITEVNDAIGRWSEFADEAGCRLKVRTTIGEAIQPCA